MRIRRILVSQPEPNPGNSPYNDLAVKHNLKIDFRQFIQVEGVPAKDFRKDRIQILDHTAIIFTSRAAIDHFFRISQELRLTIPDSMKYFCISEATAFYLQKYIVYRKRKIFYANGKFADLVDVLMKHKEDKFLIPLSDVHKDEIPTLLEKAKIQVTEAIMYRTVSADLSDLKEVNYDVLVFFTPVGIKSLMQNFPDFEQNETKIATFGPATAQAVRDAGLRLDVEAPIPEAPSMPAALERFIAEWNKNNK
ncbi:MAG: uroporphyrinogen-III synthase [Mariniphaga sp.]